MEIVSIKDTETKIKITLLFIDEILHLQQALCHKLISLGFEIYIDRNNGESSSSVVDFAWFKDKPEPKLFELVEYTFQKVAFEFDKLETLVEGESKVLRLLTSKVVVELFKPTVYSYTHNRYGVVNGTSQLRALFTAEIFRKMNRAIENENANLRNAFLALVPFGDNFLLIQEKVESSNLEVRVKRYHVGSPVHRYKFTEQFNSVQRNTEPIKKWTKFDKPVVCFDWRNPLNDEAGNRLADEPISDDYASVWMNNIPEAKLLARDTFLWLEELFFPAGVMLVDICFFIDRSGKVLFGEISPDCMRVRNGFADPENSESMDKDLWRQGSKSEVLAERYEMLLNKLFNQTLKTKTNGKHDN